MKVTRVLMTAATALLVAGPAAAQSSKEQEKLEAEVKKLKEEVEALKARADEAEVKAKDAVVAGDIPGSFRVPGTDLSIKIYGFAELNYNHLFRGDNSDSDYSTFAPYLPLNGADQAKKKNRDYLTARTSRLGVETAYPTRFGVLQTKIEGDFNNEPRLGGAAVYDSPDNSNTPKGVFTQQVTNSYGFRIRHAYGQFGGLLAGMTWSTFMDVDNMPETVDFNGPIGATFLRQPVIRYTYSTPTIGGLTVALENSSSYVYSSGGSTMVSSHSRMPDLVLRWDRGFGWGSMSIRAMTQELRVDDGAGAKAEKRGWGVGSSALIKTRGGADFLTLAVTGGEGIGRYLNYIEGAFYDDVGQKIIVERAAGAWIGYQLKPNGWVRINANYGLTRHFNNGYTDFARANGLDAGRFGINRMVQQAHLGPIFTPIKGVDLGAEAIWAMRKTLAGEKGDDFRINLSAKYYIN